MAGGVNLDTAQPDLDQWIMERLRHAKLMLHESVDIDPDIRGGAVVLRNTRFPVARILAEIADDRTVSELAEDFDLDVDLLKKLLQGMAVCFERPAVE